MQPLSILITNDDGYGTEGLKALEESLAPMGAVWVIAPDREQSGQGHALTLNHPLRFQRRAPRHFVVQGTPTDCVYLGIHTILKEEGRPRLVVSGINRGYNLGDDITYSGTVSAAFEATLMSLPSRPRLLGGLRDRGLGRAGLRPEIRPVRSDLAARSRSRREALQPLRQPPRGVRMTRQGRRIYPGGVIERIDPKGRAYYWIGGQSADWEDDPESDFRALADGFVSVTPLHLDLTHYKVMDLVRRWNLDL